MRTILGGKNENEEYEGTDQICSALGGQQAGTKSVTSRKIKEVLEGEVADRGIHL